MQYLNIARLDGIPMAYQEQLSQLAPKLRRRDLLLIVLYFMSELSDDQHSHENIERNMRLIFPRDDYSEYAASNIRGLFNTETSQVKLQKLKPGQRLWINLAEGYWRNSALGNEAAKRVLEECELELFVGGTAAVHKKAQKEIQRVERGLKQMEGKEREQLRRARVNQGVFRDILFEQDQCCRVCGLARRELLIASHIKAWAVSTGIEKMDGDNGFLLCPVHDALFDKHLISFQDCGSIILSQRLTQQELPLLHVGPDIEIQVRQGNKKYLKHHREILIALEERV